MPPLEDPESELESESVRSSGSKSKSELESEQHYRDSITLVEGHLKANFCQLWFSSYIQCGVQPPGLIHSRDKSEKLFIGFILI